MMVDELIEELKKYPPDMHIVSFNAQDEAYSTAIWGTEVMYFDGEDRYYDEFDYGKAMGEKLAINWKKMLVVKL